MTPWDDVGLTGTVFSVVGYGKGSWSVGLFAEVSNATRLQQLNGFFQYQSAAVTLADGLGLSCVFFWGGSVIGADLGLSLAGPAAYYVPVGVSYTWVYKINDRLEANLARGAWDYLLGGGFLGGAFMNAWINFARWFVSHRRH
jgi:hypothetical protein